MRFNFTPEFATVGELPGVYSIADLERERGVYSATPEFVRRNCGDIARAILSLVPEWYYAEADKLGLYPNCDVRIHRLYPGDFPAYPGWHCDGEYRETYFSQPDLDKIKVGRHLTCHVSSHAGGVSCTQFLDEPFVVEVGEVDSEHTLWGAIHSQLERQQSRLTYDSRDGQMILFNPRTLHRAMPASIRGWRLFFRMSMWHRPNLGDGGMLTKQEQVYKLAEGGGW